jgi:hypothetical protein
VGHAPAQAPVALGVAQEVDDLCQFGLGLVDAGNILERDADLFRIDASRLRAPEFAECAHAPGALRGAFVDQHEQADDQQGRAEPEQQLGQQRLAGGRRFGLDLNSLFLQQRGQLAAVPEARHLRGELLRGRRLLVARGVAQLGLELALDRVALGGDRADRAPLDLFQKIRAERHRHAFFAGGGLEEQHRQPVERDQREHEVPEAAHAVRRRSGVGVLGHPTPVGRGGDVPAPFVARQRRMRVRAARAQAGRSPIGGLVGRFVGHQRPQVSR